MRKQTRMKISTIGVASAVTDPTRCATWFEDHLGFAITVNLGWYVATHHPDSPDLSLDFVKNDHESWPEATRGKTIAGSLLAFLVEDVDAEHDRLKAAGLEIVLPPVTEPWGQRRFQIAGPDGLLVEVLQLVAPDPEWLAENGLAG